MNNVQKFESFLNERLAMNNNLAAQAAYIIVKNQFNLLFNKPVETTNEQPKCVKVEDGILCCSTCVNYCTYTGEKVIPLLERFGLKV